MTATDTQLLEEPEPAAVGPRLRWWWEVVAVAVFYGVYTLIRDTYASNGGRTEAETHARWVVRAEQDLHIFWEQHIQHFFAGTSWFFQFWNTWYGTVHFVAVVGVLVFLFRWHPERYQLWRNTFAIMNLLALIGFAFFPLAPPRLLPGGYHFVDTLARYGGPWNFDNGPAASASNQFAAMPSMHTGWSTWVAVALLPSLRSRWAKVAIFLYPAATVFCIVLTGNHYFLDAVGGLVSLGLAYLLARPFTAWWVGGSWRRFLPRRLAA